jgi:ParB-like chromosome segregation protein Spo0J
MTDLLSLKYIPISQAELFDSNAKLHNLDQIIQSITHYGFKSACKWESTLNGGRGGIVAGNGRVEALREMERRGDDLPIGIAQDTETGEWCVPVLFGVEAESEAIARAYALDDNNLTLLGGDLALSDLKKLYNQELLMSELEELAQLRDLPVTFDNDFVKNSLQFLTNGESSENSNKDLDSLSSTKEINTDDNEFQHKCPKCHFKFND